MNTVIIGVGGAAEHFHLPLLKQCEGLTLTAVVSSKSSDEVRYLTGISNVYQSVESLLANERVNLAIVLTPNFTHFDIAKSLLLKGINTIVDKPFTETVAQAEHLIQIASENNALLSVFHNRRWDGDFLTVKKLIAQDILGQIRYFESRFDKYKPVPNDRWKEQAFKSNGFIYDMAPHLIDQMLCLFGVPLSVNASIRQMRPTSKTSDYFSIRCQYKELEVMLRSSAYAIESPFRYYVEGTKGVYCTNFTDAKGSMLHSPLAKNLQSCEDIHGQLINEKGKSKIKVEPGEHQTFYENIAQSLSNRDALAVQPEQALNVMRVIEAAKKSHTNKFEVNLCHVSS